LPRVEIFPPSEGLVLYEGDGTKAFTVQGRLTDVPDDPNGKKFTAKLWVNGKPSLKLDPTGTLPFTARVPVENLKPGKEENRLRIVLTNDWGERVESDELLLRYLRPPRNIIVNKPQVGQKALIDLTAQATSAVKVLPESVKVTVNKRDITAEAQVKKLAQPAVWEVSVTGVPLLDDPNEPDKPNEIELWIGNEEGLSLQSGKLQVARPKAPPKRPSVKFTEPVENANVTTPDLTLYFQVQSPGPLRRVELIREGAVELRQPFLVGDGKAGVDLKVAAHIVNRQNKETPRPVNAAQDPTKLPEQNGYRKLEMTWPLEPGQNRFRVVAVNDGGEEEAALVINYLYMPVRLVIEDLKCDGVSLLAEGNNQPGGRLRFKKAPNGRAELSASLVWDDPKDEQLRLASYVRIYVNGFQQIPALLRDPEPGAPRTRKFVKEISLNRAADNLVEIDLPSNKQEARNRPNFTVSCAQPAEKQNLHLLVIGVYEQDREKLMDRAKKAVESQAFDGKPKYYGPLTGYVTADKVFTYLDEIKNNIDDNAKGGAINDVVMIYYQGKEDVCVFGHYFLMSNSDSRKQYPQTAVCLDGVAQAFLQTLGATVLLVDVAREEEKGARDMVVRWPEEVRAGVFRAAWKEQGQAVPAAGPLLDAWQEVTPKQGLLNDINKKVRTLLEKPGLKYEWHLPSDLENLTVGQLDKSKTR
jgi:hypothetical protein